MTETLKTISTRIRPGVTRRINRNKKVIVSRQEVEKAMRKYLKGGGVIIQLRASDDQRGYNEWPNDPMDLIEKYNEGM